MKRKGFTLVEILIVVIILGILAAIVVPQFTDASTDAKESNLTSNLQSFRAQLELYRLQHDGSYPTAANLVTNMTTKVGDYGPYLLQFPVNPFNNLATIDSTTKGGGNAGWYYDEDTGEFTADDDDHSSL